MQIIHARNKKEQTHKQPNTQAHTLQAMAVEVVASLLTDTQHLLLINSLSGVIFYITEYLPILAWVSRKGVKEFDHFFCIW